VLSDGVWLDKSDRLPTSEAYIYAADFLTTYGRAEVIFLLLHLSMC
jgi:hypothetical protein